jgi:hypothetical protein
MLFDNTGRAALCFCMKTRKCFEITVSTIATELVHEACVSGVLSVSALNKISNLQILKRLVNMWFESMPGSQLTDKKQVAGAI